MRQMFLIYDPRDGEYVGLFDSLNTALAGLKRYLGTEIVVANVTPDEGSSIFDVRYKRWHGATLDSSVLATTGHIYIEIWDVNSLIRETKKRQKEDEK